MRPIRGTELKGKVTRVPGADIGNAPQNVILKNTPPVVVPTYFTETRAPTAFDDIDDGAVIHSQWINTVDNTVYTCTNPMRGDAIWVPSSF